MQQELLAGHECETAAETIREQMGCDKPMEHDENKCFRYDGLWMDRCPAYYVKRSWAWIKAAMDMFNWREKGFLPEPGTWRDQPSVNIQICEYIERLQSERTRQCQNR